jgi:amino-acid N-acetyltransferase
VNPQKNFHFRLAKEGDQKAIRGLIRRVRINPLNLDWHNFVLAVDKHGQMIGCGQIKIHRDGTNELASIAVEREWRGQGVATTIIQSLLESARLPIWLVCQAELEAFYKRFGFRVVEEINSLPKAYRRMRSISRLFSRVFPGIGQFRIMILETNA